MKRKTSKAGSARKATASSRTSKTSKTRKTGTARGASAAAKAGRSAARKPATRPAARPVDPAAQQAAWMKAMTPGVAHGWLEATVGTFIARTEFRMSPTGPPMTGTGVSENRWVLGGRFVEQSYRGDSMGMPFEGIGFTGYDNVQEKYIGLWMDSMGCSIMSSVGTGSPTPRRLTFRSVGIDPMTGKEVVFRSLVSIPDRDRHVYEMWTKGPDGKDFQTLKVEYTRK